MAVKNTPSINVCIILLLISISYGACTSQGSVKEDKVIMGIFAHPDDEISVGPLLAKYAREGVKVYLVTVTDGRYGTGHSGLPSGEELVALRKDELACAAEKMGIEYIWLGYHDQLRLKEGFFGHVPLAQQLIKEVDSLVTTLQPDVLITWGPDGGSNHMDHRLVGATVTQVFARKSWEKPAALYYYGTPAHMIEDEEAKVLRGVDEKYLTTHIAYTEEDFNKAMDALACYKSQFSPEQIQNRISYLKKFNLKVYLRPFAGSSVHSEDIF
jgi:LmbE family N-acetylglucosaminyl deacetylase